MCNWSSQSGSNEEETLEIQESSDDDLPTPSTSVPVVSTVTAQPSTSVLTVEAAVTANLSTYVTTTQVPLNTALTTTSAIDSEQSTSNVTYRKTNRFNFVYITKS